MHDDQGDSEQRGWESGGELIDPKDVVGRGHEPIDEDRLGDPELSIESGGDEITGREHLAARFGIAAFIAIGQPHAAEANKKEQAGQKE